MPDRNGRDHLHHRPGGDKGERARGRTQIFCDGDVMSGADLTRHSLRNCNRRETGVAVGRTLHLRLLLLLRIAVLGSSDFPSRLLIWCTFFQLE
jgi:hypothetical protein